MTDNEQMFEELYGLIIGFECEFGKSRKINNIYKFVEKIEKELELLDKYKRAFEILKDYSIIPPLEDFRYSEYTNCYFAEIEEYDHDYEDYRTIHYVLEKDEYELLEELMKDAKD